jgi:hypothetical protein
MIADRTAIGTNCNIRWIFGRMLIFSDRMMKDSRVKNVKTPTRIIDYKIDLIIIHSNNQHKHP